MTQDEVIKLARGAGGDWDHLLPEDQEFLIRFASLIEAKVKADLLAGAGEPVAYALANQEKTSGSPCPTCQSLARAVMMDQTGVA